MSDAMLYGIIFISYEQLIQVNPEVDEYKLAYAQVTIQSRSASWSVNWSVAHIVSN